jgi:hypothetical protein
MTYRSNPEAPAGRRGEAGLNTGPGFTPFVQSAPRGLETSRSGAARYGKLRRAVVAAQDLKGES